MLPPLEEGMMHRIEENTLLALFGLTHTSLYQLSNTSESHFVSSIQSPYPIGIGASSLCLLSAVHLSDLVYHTLLSTSCHGTSNGY